MWSDKDVKPIMYAFVYVIFFVMISDGLADLPNHKNHYIMNY